MVTLSVINPRVKIRAVRPYRFTLNLLPLLVPAEVVTLTLGEP